MTTTTLSAQGENLNVRSAATNVKATNQQISITTRKVKSSYRQMSQINPLIIDNRPATEHNDLHSEIQIDQQRPFSMNQVGARQTYQYQNRPSDYDLIKQRQLEYKKKPLFLHGIDPIKFIENAKQNDLKPYMALYFENFKQKRQIHNKSAKLERRTIQIKQNTSDKPANINNQASNSATAHLESKTLVTVTPAQSSPKRSKSGVFTSKKASINETEIKYLKTEIASQAQISDTNQAKQVPVSSIRMTRKLIQNDVQRLNARIFQLQNIEDRTLSEIMNGRKQTELLMQKREDVQKFEEKFKQVKENDLNKKRINFLKRNTLETSEYACSQASVFYPKIALDQLIQNRASTIKSFKIYHQSLLKTRLQEVSLNRRDNTAIKEKIRSVTAMKQAVAKQMKEKLMDTEVSLIEKNLSQVKHLQAVEEKMLKRIRKRELAKQKIANELISLRFHQQNQMYQQDLTNYEKVDLNMRTVDNQENGVTEITQQSHLQQ